MADGKLAPETKQYLPHDLVSQVLLHLPIRSLMRFACMSRTWHDTITGDRCFQRRHFRLRESCVLIFPRIRSYVAGQASSITTPGLYRWERNTQPNAATLVQAMDFLPQDVPWRHNLAHCDGLVLVPMDGCKVRVLNPATRRLVTLPPTESPRGFEGAFGLGHDSRTGTYKVAHFFYRSQYSLLTGVDPCNLGMEVFSIGTDQQWRETLVSPPYPVLAGKTATFFKSSLLWMIDESLIIGRGDVDMRGFLRFNLEDESFSFLPAPPGCPELRYSTSNLAEIRGELCFAQLQPPNHGPPENAQASQRRKVWIWACDGVIPPRWVQRHVIEAPSCINMISASDTENGVVVQRGSCILECSNRGRIEVVISLASMDKLKYRHPDQNKVVEYTGEAVDGYYAIPYVPSLVPI